MGRVTALHPYTRRALASHRCRDEIDYRTWLMRRIQAQAMRPLRLTAPNAIPHKPNTQPHRPATTVLRPIRKRNVQIPSRNLPQDPRRPGSSGTPNARRWVRPRSSGWHETKPGSPSTVRRFKQPAPTHTPGLSPRPPAPISQLLRDARTKTCVRGKGEDGMRVCWIQVLCDLINPTR